MFATDLKKWLLNDRTGLYWCLRKRYFFANNTLLRIILFCILKRIEAKCNADLGVSYHNKSSVFESDPICPHGLNGIVISRKCNIGKNLTILQQVTIGTKITTEMSTKNDDRLAPSIGDNVYVGAGAKIIGNIHVGNNVLIGANSVVTKSVPDNYTAVGNPAKYFETKNVYKRKE